jgi:hypothetical protein
MNGNNFLNSSFIINFSRPLTQAVLTDEKNQTVWTLRKVHTV